MRTELECPNEGSLRAYLDRELLARQQAAVAEHLAQCGRCATALAGLRSRADLAGAALSALPGTAPPVAPAWERFRRRATDRPRNPLLWRLETMRQSLSARHLRPALVGVSLAALALSLVFVAPLRTTASQFLDIFRVRRIAVISIDPENLRTLDDFSRQIFIEPEVERAIETAVKDAAEAQALAGHLVLLPSYVPEGLGAPSQLVVVAARQAWAQVNVPAARALLAAAGLPTDALPSDPDDASMTASIPPIVVLLYGTEGADDPPLAVYQMASPEVTVPEGMDLARLGELGLQALGLSPEEAQRLSQSIDWATTLVIPVPADVASAREVQVRGASGYVLEGKDESGHNHAMVLWQENDLLYMVAGTLPTAELLQVAESLE